MYPVTHLVVNALNRDGGLLGPPPLPRRRTRRRAAAPRAHREPHVRVLRPRAP
jgi:hypothetical protein